MESREGFAVNAPVLMRIPGPGDAKKQGMSIPTPRELMRSLRVAPCTSKGFLAGTPGSKPSLAGLSHPYAAPQEVWHLQPGFLAVPRTAAFGAFLQGLCDKNPLEKLGGVLEEGVPTPSPGGCQQRASPGQPITPITQISLTISIFSRGMVIFE